MNAAVTIVDYGMGNLLSVARAFEHCGARAIVTSSGEQVRNAERLVLPGVGAFKDGMAGLRACDLVDPILEFCASGRSFLGICLGMQMMMETSEEFGHHAGLGLVPGTVVEIPRESGGARRKIPHIGWNALRPGAAGTGWQRTVLEGTAPDSAAYFVHSYAVSPASSTHILAECSYDGYRIVAALRSGALYGCQFHPEKSGETGLRIIRRFCEV